METYANLGNRGTEHEYDLFIKRRNKKISRSFLRHIDIID